MNNIKNIITAIFLVVGLAANAAVEPIITGSSSKTFTVDLADWAAYDVAVVITDAKGEVLINDEIKDAPGKIYNLKSLANGTYNVAVSNSLRTINSSVAISGSNVSVIASSTTYKPIVTIKDGYFDVNALAQGRTVTVSVLDAEGEVFSTSYRNTAAISKRFVTTDLPAGEYTVVVRKGNDTITKTISK